MATATTAAALEEKSKLRRHFARFDILFFLICTCVGLDTLGAVAGNGAQAFTWLVFLGLLFFIPYAFLSAELGTAFPQEGGPYVWCRLAFGRFAAALTTVVYWIANPIWLGGALTITAVTTFGEFVTPLDGFWKYGFSLLFIWTGVAAAIVSFRIGKWLPTLGAFVRVVLLSFFSITVIVYAAQHGVHGFGAGDFAPTYAIFIAAVPVLVFNYVGFELPNAAGEEMKNPARDVPFAVARSAVGTLLLYGIPILSILLVLPTDRISSLEGFIDAMKTVFTVYGGSVTEDGATLTGLGKVLGVMAAVGFILALLTSGTTWIMGSDRVMAVAGFDGAGPRVFGVFSRRFGTPIVVNFVSGAVSTTVMVLAFELTSGDAGKYFSVVLGLAISTTTISYLGIFPALWKLRRSQPATKRPYRIPGGDWVAGVVSALTTFWALLATVVLLWPGLGTNWFGQDADPDAALPEGFAGQRLEFELSQLLPLAALLALGVVFYALGARTRREVVVAPDEPVEQTAPA